MNEISAKFKRQIEILGIAINNTESLGTNELAEMYGVERLTIKRDLQELRRYGIDIHSEGKKGTRLARKVPEARLRGIIGSYLSLTQIGTLIDKAGTLLTKKCEENALHNIVRIQHCIEQGKMVGIDYHSEHRKEPMHFAVGPLHFFQADALWRLLAIHEGILKQFLLTKIVNANPQGCLFTRPSEADVEAVVCHSWGSWIGTGRFRVRLKLSKELSRKLDSRRLIMADKTTMREDGSVIVEMTVNSVEEMARWIVGQGKGVTVEAPTQLRRLAISLARDTLRNYQKQQ